MIVSEIYDEVKDITGNCDSTIVFRTITRAIELLANEKLVDPLVGYLELSVNNSFWIALPRDVKTPLRINIDNNPSFPRSRIFEFTNNTGGSIDGEEVGWSYANRGHLPIQDETQFPGVLSYVAISPSDEGKTITVFGLDVDGREISEEIAALREDPVASTQTFYEIRKVLREAAVDETYLKCADENIARYYPDETTPEYRVIKLSKTGVALRMMYRKHVFKITALTDIIPIHSSMAVIHAAKAVQLFKEEAYDKGQASLALAVDFLTKEQASRDEMDSLSSQIDTATATDEIIASRDGVIVADIYDAADAIFQGVGRRKLFDRITTAIELLNNKGEWDGSIGAVDVYKSDTSAVESVYGTGVGYFVLPRFVEGVMAVNVNGMQRTPHNKWFEFHLNGPSERSRSGMVHWDDQEETCIINPIPVNTDTKRPVAQKLAVVCENVLDVDKIVRVFGYDADERQITAIIPCKEEPTPDESGPEFTRITRIEREATIGACRLWSVAGTIGSYVEVLLFGYWYPDETEPKYRAIKISNTAASRVRIKYRKRIGKITSLYEPIHLRSRQAIECMLRALKLQSTDIAASEAMEAKAVKYLEEERTVSFPAETGILQFHTRTMPGVHGNIQ